MIWLAPCLEKSLEKPRSSRLFPHLPQSQKNAKQGCLIDLLGYSVFVTRILRGDGYRLA
jgi:hypothetical protein